MKITLEFNEFIDTIYEVIRKAQYIVKEYEKLVPKNKDLTIHFNSGLNGGMIEWEDGYHLFLITQTNAYKGV